MATEIHPPVGTIAAYAGPITPAWETASGWLKCDGRSLNRTNADYTALFNKIGSSWGGDGVNQFNIPDLRGNFLRGVDDGTGRDPDAGSRVASNAGGHTGNQVGSVQDSQFKHHAHSITGHRLEASGGHGFEGSGFDSNSAQNGAWVGPYASAEAGGAETRPRNANVFWIIRFK